MKLRKLEEKDAKLMLEWMHDKSVVEFMGANFEAKTIDDCKKFIILLRIQIRICILQLWMIGMSIWEQSA